jgi:hypothetical protein
MLYQTLSQITAPQVKRSTKINFFGGTMATAESKQVSREDYLVDLISRQQVGIYDVSILTARKAQTMIDWFNSRGYSLKQQALPMVENYLESDWYFVAIRVNVTKYSAGHYGELPPLQFKFNSSNIVYPMKISSLNPGDTEVLAYVLADRKVKPVFARSECYGVDPTRIKLDWNQTFKELSAEELAKPRPDYIAGCSLFVPGKTYYKLEYAGKVGPGLDGFAEKEYFLTKVRMKFNESNPIKSDIVFVNYGDNKTFRMIVDERGNEIKESRLQMLWDALIMLFQRR